VDSDLGLIAERELVSQAAIGASLDSGRAPID
jgi:hypothetical protein